MPKMEIKRDNNYVIYSPRATSSSLELLEEILLNSPEFQFYQKHQDPNKHIGAFKAKLIHAFMFELNKNALAHITHIPELKNIENAQAYQPQIGLTVDITQSDISINAAHPALGPNARNSLHGDKIFAISRQEVQSLLDSMHIFINEELPTKFYQLLCQFNRGNDFFFNKFYLNQDKDKIYYNTIPLNKITDLKFKAIMNEVVKNPAEFGFRNSTHFQRIFSQTIQQLGTYVVITQKAYSFIDGNYDLQEKPAKPFYSVSSAAIDFASHDEDLKLYFWESKDNMGFKSEESKKDFKKR